MNTQLSLNFDIKPMKCCPKCKRILSLDQFYKNKSRRDNFSSYCKKCVKRYRQKNKEKLAKKEKRYYQNNKKRITEYQKKWRQDNKEEIVKKSKQYYQDNKEEIVKKSKQYYQDNKKEAIKRGKRYRQNNPEKITKAKKRYKQNHRKEIAEYQNQKYKENSRIRLNKSISEMIKYSLKTQNIIKNGRRWKSLVNFTLEELIIHLEGLFQDGMNWENHGKWHVDHIKPISLFDFESVEDPGFKECWSLNNLQPLWAKENLEKSNKYHEW